MNAMADKFFDSIKGKKVTFIGIGTSNLPLIKLFIERVQKLLLAIRRILKIWDRTVLRLKSTVQNFYSVKLSFRD